MPPVTRGAPNVYDKPLIDYIDELETMLHNERVRTQEMLIREHANCDLCDAEVKAFRDNPLTADHCPQCRRVYA